MNSKLFKKIFFSLLLGFLIGLGLIQNQKKFKSIIKNKIKNLIVRELDCDIEFEISKINFIFPSIELINVLVSDNDIHHKKWYWECDKLKIKCSWLDYLISGNFKADIQIKSLNIISEVSDNNLSIATHINKLLFASNSSLPLIIHYLKLNKTKFKIYNPDNTLIINSSFNSESKTINNAFITWFYLDNCNITNNNNQIAENISGNIQVIIPNLNSNHEIFFNLLCNIPNLSNDSRSFIIGNWTSNKGALKINSIDGKININITKIVYQNNKILMTLKSEFPIFYINKILTKLNNLEINGKCFIEIDGTYDLPTKKIETLNGKITLENLTTNLHPFILDKIYLNFSHANNILNGSFYINKNNFFKLLGNINFDLDKSIGNILCTNNNEINLNQDWNILPRKVYINTKFNSDLDFETFYSIEGTNEKINKNIKCEGKINYLKKQFKSFGFINKTKYRLDLDSQFNLKRFCFFDEKNNKLLEARSDNKFFITAYFQHLKTIINNIFDISLAGIGIINLEAELINKKLIGKINLIDGNIIIPKTYNYIKNGSGNFEINTNTSSINLSDIDVNFYKGKIESKKAKFIFDNNFEATFIHFPILIKSCLLNWQKDIITTLSGRLLVTKNKHKSIRGNIIIDKAIIKNNIFSEDFRKEILGNKYQTNDIEKDIQLNISLITKKPINIKTNFIQIEARVNLLIEKNLSNPQLSGNIELINGKIIFPYKPLNIINGNILFLTDQSYDPLINLVARNKIKRFIVTMNVTGSAQEPFINFDASPPLSEEQIGILLLVGSENASLNAIMPTLIMQNFKNIIFGSAQTHSKMAKYFDTVLKPFKQIRFIPSFSDETGRSGFKGAIEVEVNDKLRASIEKNFTQPEDFKVEIDYDLTDDVSFKAIKDERGDLGAEIEMRWKF